MKTSKEQIATLEDTRNQTEQLNCKVHRMKDLSDSQDAVLRRQDNLINKFKTIINECKTELSRGTDKEKVKEDMLNALKYNGIDFEIYKSLFTSAFDSDSKEGKKKSKRKGNLVILVECFHIISPLIKT